VDAAAVVLAPVVGTGSADLSRHRALETDSDGRFVLTEPMPSGRYRVMAFASLPEDWSSSPSFFSQYESQGRLVDLSSGARSRVELPLIFGR
jgi:hypothetical protein